MLIQKYRWKNKQIRDQAAIIDGEKSPDILLKNARYLHSTLHQWMKGNIWIYEDRIVYVGEALPEKMDSCEVIDCTGQTLVPGYIEPHAHPFILYNPQTFAYFASQQGTTVTINDNLFIFLHLQKKKAFSLLGRLSKSPVSMYWRSRYDAQTELTEEDAVFSNSEVKAWIEHDAVIQGGELSGWPKLQAGDDLMLHWIQETKRIGKRVEGHFPGASDMTLARMKLFGADGDHEAMTGQDVYKRLLHGYTVALRYSSVRPDLPNILEELKEMGLSHYDSMFFTTDGSTPSFFKQGMTDTMIKIAIEAGVPIIDAYHMASYNIARYYKIDHLHGVIAAGRVANINFLSDEMNPTPVTVLAKGKWVKREDGENITVRDPVAWAEYGVEPLSLDWDISEDDMQFSMPFGVEMVNNVITKPYSISRDVSMTELPKTHDESFFMLLDRNGKWRINTILKGFSKSVSGLVSSFSTTGDIILIGKNKQDMILAFNRMKEIGGGIVLAEDGKIIHEIPLPLLGLMTDEELPALIEQEEKLKKLLVERGYLFPDPIYSLFIFTSTHLPYIRLTQRGMYDVMNKTILFPTLMR